MPLYEYYCSKCKTFTEIRHSIKDIGKDFPCGKCLTILKKVFSRPHIREKGDTYKQIGKHKSLMRKYIKE